MKRFLLSTLAFAAGVLDVLAYNPALTLSDGALYEQSDVAHAVASASGKAGNNLIELEGDATIRITDASQDTLGWPCYVNTGFYSKNGLSTLTLDYTAIPPTEAAILTGTYKVRKLIIKGHDDITLWAATSAPSGNMPTWEVDEVEFQDADGNPLSSPIGFKIQSLLCLVKLPTGVPIRVENNALLCLGGENVLERENFMGGAFCNTDAYTFDTFDVYAIRPEAIPAGKKIRIGAGRTFDVRPYTFNFDGGNLYNWHGFTTSFVFDNPVELLDETSVLTISQHYFSKIQSAVTGPGTIRLSPNNGKVNDNYLMRFEPVLDGFTGTLEVRNTNAKSPIHLAAPMGGISTITVDRLSSIGSDVAMLAVTSGVSLAVGTLSGSIQISRVGGNVDVSAAVDDMDEGTVLTCGSGVALTSPETLPGKQLVKMRASGNDVIACVRSGETLDVSSIPLDSRLRYTLEEASGVPLANVPGNVTLAPSEGTTLEVAGGMADGKIKMREATLVVRPSALWKNKVMGWFDASVAESVEPFDGDVKTYQNKGDYPLVHVWGDRRGEGTTLRFIQSRYDTGTDTQAEYVFPFVAPYSETLNYIACANLPADRGSDSRRMAIQTFNGTKWTGAEIAPKFIVLVYGSQAGGGKAIFGSSAGSWERSSLTDFSAPLTGNAKVEAWMDGRSVVPTTTGFNGDWQIVSLRPNGLLVQGIGFSKVQHQDAGHCNYAEILFFNEDLTDEERIDVERYLAKKWNLSASYAGHAAARRINPFGTGTITLEDDAELGGAFKGTVDLNGQMLSFADVPPPPDETALSAEGRVGWFDPDFTGTVKVDGKDREGTLGYTSDARYQNPPLVVRMFDREKGATTGEGSLSSTGGGRAPAAVPYAFEFGTERTWIDFGNFYAKLSSGAISQGNTLRFLAYPKSAYNDPLVPLTARTVVLVQNSVHGGGTPFMDSVVGSKIMPRIVKGETPSAAMPIWRAGSTAANAYFKPSAGGHTYLDGCEVDGTVSGFSGGPEVFTAVGSQAFNIGVFGSYQLIDGVAENLKSEILGEILIYNRVLDDDERTTAENYLMNKWLGIFGSGYACTTNLTVTGSGTLRLASLAQLPKFADDFSGDVVVPEDAGLVFDVVDGVVRNPLDLGRANVAFGAANTMTVNVAGPISSGVYTLAKVGGFSAPETFAPVINKTSGAEMAVRYDANAKAVVLEVKDGSTLILFR